jgi:Trk K+ transport system NAD-binding subunit
MALFVMRKVYPDSPLIGKPLKQSKKIAMVCALIRQDALYDLSEVRMIEEGDIIVASGKIEDKDEIERWIYTL